MFHFYFLFIYLLPLYLFIFQDYSAVSAGSAEIRRNKHQEESNKSGTNRIERVENEMRSYYAANAALQAAIQSSETVRTIVRTMKVVFLF